jgi:hypothetical protein
VLGQTACSLRKWSHTGVPASCICMLRSCANLWRQSRTCSTRSGSCTTLFCLYTFCRGRVVLVVFLPGRMGPTLFLRHAVWAPVDCLYHVVICARLSCVRRHVLPCVHALQIAVACCSTLIDNGVMLGVGRSVVERVQFVAVVLLPLHLGTHLPKTS